MVLKKPGCILMLIIHIDFREQKKTNYIKSVHLLQIERFEVSAGNAQLGQILLCMSWLPFFRMTYKSKFKAGKMHT